MRHVLASILAGTLFSLSAAFAAEVEGVKLADRVQVGSAELALNGAGVRTRVFFKVYVGALYLQTKSNAAEAVLADAGPKRIAMHMLRDLGAEQLLSALKDGLGSNHSPEQLAKLAPQVKQLEDIFNLARAAKSGDVILLDYQPGTGTRIMVRGDDKGTISGEEFNRALLRIWLGDRPVDAALKKAMLGG